MRIDLFEEKNTKHETNEKKVLRYLFVYHWTDGVFW